MQTTASDTASGHMTGYGSPSYRHYVLILLMLVYTLNFIDRTLIAVVAQPVIESFQPVSYTHLTLPTKRIV